MGLDLRQVVIVNESSSRERPGDVSMFMSRQAACAYLEPTDVENGEYHAVSADGRLLELMVVEGNVTVAEVDEPSNYTQIARSLLCHMLRHVSAARKKRNGRNLRLAPETGAPTEEIVRYISNK